MQMLQNVLAMERLDVPTFLFRLFRRGVFDNRWQNPACKLSQRRQNLRPQPLEDVHSADHFWLEAHSSKAGV
jgi:hypothetical protein